MKAYISHVEHINVSPVDVFIVSLFYVGGVKRRMTAFHIIIIIVIHVIWGNLLVKSGHIHIYASVSEQCVICAHKFAGILTFWIF